ncbi:MAG TPA: methionyl-tRNA formyltransferase [Chloroflexi bacterium]|nr:methionyl-tRNA formyltransferase [Chloroflexota bacterium]
MDRDPATIRVIFMGTPDFAVPTLEALVDASFVDVVGVVTQPDRPAGRSQRLTPSDVKKEALKHDLPLAQPASLRTPEALAQLEAWQPDVIVVAAFGQLLPPDVLDLPSHGCVNVHASLLPRWRGAAPAPAAIIAGDEVTGITIMQMDPGLDTGPILAQKEVTIRADDTWETLEERLAKAGAQLLIETLPNYVAGKIVPQAQDEETATFADRIQKSEGEIDWSRPAVELARKIRAYTPWPGAYTTLHGKRFKILRATPLPKWRGEGPPGTVCALGDGTVVVVTGQGALHLEEVQLAGKRRMDIEDFLCGQRDCIGSCLGT